jgi:hypothetical protein
MRTTLILNDQVAIAAKLLAAERRVSLSQVIDDALRKELAGTFGKANEKKFSMPVFGNSTQGPIDSSPADFDALLHDDSLSSV